MKNQFIIIAAMVFFILSGAAFADDAQTKGEQTSSAVVYAGPCVITSLKLVEGGADATLTCYDSATATTSGKKRPTFWNALMAILRLAVHLRARLI